MGFCSLPCIEIYPFVTPQTLFPLSWALKSESHFTKKHGFYKQSHQVNFLESDIMNKQLKPCPHNIIQN